jgi:hypothetical protein
LREKRKKDEKDEKHRLLLQRKEMAKERAKEMKEERKRVKEEKKAALALPSSTRGTNEQRGLGGIEGTPVGKCNYRPTEKNGTSGVLVLTTTRRLLRRTVDTRA